MQPPPSYETQLQESPAFIVGSVRSGTTLLRLMLDHHPELAFHFEFEFAVDQIGADGTLPPLSDYHDYLSQHRVFLLSQGEIDPQLDYPQLVHSFLEQKRERDGKKYLGATVHHHFDRIPYVWPNAKFIHLLRDGRDVGKSCMQMTWAGNMYLGVQRWIDAELSWQRLQPQLAADQHLEVRYEDLIRAPEDTLTSICEFLGLQFDSAMFDYIESSPYDQPDERLINQWKRKQTDHEIQLAEARIAEMLVERGYKLSGLPRLQLSSRQIRNLHRQDWWRRAQLRRQRYGLPLFAVDYIARRLPFRSLQRWCKQRINSVENKCMKH